MNGSKSTVSRYLHMIPVHARGKQAVDGLDGVVHQLHVGHEHICTLRAKVCMRVSNLREQGLHSHKNVTSRRSTHMKHGGVHNYHHIGVVLNVSVQPSKASWRRNISHARLIAQVLVKSIHEYV